MILNKQDTTRDKMYLHFRQYYQRINNMTKYVIFNKIYNGTIGDIELEIRQFPRYYVYIYR